MIAVRGVTKTYRTRSGPVDALGDINLNIADHEFLSIVGPSGCGKSTLLMIIAGLISSSSGSVTIKGERVSKPYTDVGIDFQRDVLMPWRRTLDNVLVQAEFRGIPRRQMEQRGRDLLKMAGIEDFEAKYPYELSGGMRQRVSICRALVHDPPLLLMDEPFGALDALTRDQMNLDLQQIFRRTKKTVVFITHSITEAVFLGDRVVVFGPRPGRIEDEMQIDLPRPRNLSMRETPEFGVYVKRIRDAFKQMGVIREEPPGE